MNNSKKHQLNIKNKLIAAIAMLLVSSIMMVSSTYAWFTLSTAPEVQGITTTVGANGNLEIALSPLSGNPAEITSNVGDTNEEWIVKNLTWGNLLDLSDASYGLGEITLMPSQLNITASQDATKLNTLGANPLKVAIYGADGRIDELSADKVTFGAKNPNANVDGFIVNTGVNDLFGIRAVGTSSTQSETALNFQNALSAISNNRGAANGQVSGALVNYGDVLAAIALKYANGDTTGYEAYVVDLRAMINELDSAADKIEASLYNALLAISISNLPVDLGSDLASTADDTMITDVTVRVGDVDMPLYDAFKANMENGISLSTTWDMITSYTTVLQQAFPALYKAYTGWNNINTNVSAAKAAAAALSTTSASDTDIKGVVRYLMDTSDDSSVTINGIAIDSVKANPGQLFGGGVSGINLQLNAGSGIFAYYGELTGNVTGSVTVPDGAMVGSYNVGGATINIMTTTEPAAGPSLNQVRTAIALIGVTSADDSGDASVIDVTYGYALDFIFRTNAANSSLLLQSDAAQRIYGDSQNAATMGAGSTMTFDGTSNNLQTLVDMMSGIRVVFMETNGEDVYGIARVTVSQVPLTFAAKTVVVGTDAEGNPTYTDGADADLELALTVSHNGAVNTMGWSFGAEAITNNVANATLETVVDPLAQTTYQRVKVLAITGNEQDGFEVDETSEPTYYHIYDQDVELKGELSLYNYTVGANGALTFTTVQDVQSICTLDQNVPTKITALVYLDGDYIDNSDVTNSENGISNTGKLNLQFRSSANLVPMNNSTLDKGFGVKLPTVEGLTIEGKSMTAAKTDYTFTIAAPVGYEYTVTYTVDGVDKGELTNNGGQYKIDKANVTGNIEIFVEVTAEPAPSTP